MPDFSSNISFAPLAQQIPKGDVKLTPQLAENLRALFNPSKVLEEKQSELIGAISQFKTEKLSGDIARTVSGDIEQYRQKAQEMLKSNKGMNRLNFTDAQKIELGQMRAKLAQDINYGVGQLEALPDAVKRGTTLASYGRMKEGWLEALMSWDKRNAGKPLADREDVNALLATYVQQPTVEDDEAELKDLKRYYDTMLGAFDLRTYSIKPSDIDSQLEINYPFGTPAWDEIRGDHEVWGYVSPSDSDDVAKEKIRNVTMSRYKRRPPPTPRTTTQPEEIEATIIEGGRKRWGLETQQLQYSGKDINGIVLQNADVSEVFERPDGTYGMKVIMKVGGGLSMFPAETKEHEVNMSSGFEKTLKNKKYKLKGYGEKKKSPDKTETNNDPLGIM